jgi:hypothetical protein
MPHASGEGIRAILAGVPEVDVTDSTWIAARPATVAAIVAEPANWRRWWPDLDLAVDEWRGDKGVRWVVGPTPNGESGSMEVWLQPSLDGVVAHYFLRLDAVSGTIDRRRRKQIADTYRRRAKQVFWTLGDQLDPGRLARLADPGRR